MMTVRGGTPEQNAQAATAARPKGAAPLWPFIVVGLLLLQIGLSVAGAYLATRGQSFSVEDDYYNKALHWDDYAALARASAALGWKSELTIGSAATAAGRRAVVLHLTDKDGHGIAGATVQMICFHHARANAYQDLTLHATEPGVYVTDALLDRAGTWEFRFTVSRGREMFINTTAQEL